MADRIKAEKTGVQGAAEQSVGAGEVASQVGANQNLATAKSADKNLGDSLQRMMQLINNKQMGEHLVSSYTPEQKKQAYEHYNKNLAQTNPLGNLNNKSYNDTLAMSRQADAINNHLWYTPTDIGARSVKLGSSPIQMETAHRKQPIETQEMRQMRANEAVDMQARQRQAQLQGDVNQHALELRKGADTASMQQAASYMQLDPTMEGAYRQANMQLNYISPAQLAQQAYMNAFMQYQNNAITYDTFNDFNYLYGHSPVLAAALSGKLGITTPQQKEMIAQYIVNQYAKEEGVSMQSDPQRFMELQNVVFKIISDQDNLLYQAQSQSIGDGQLQTQWKANHEMNKMREQIRDYDKSLNKSDTKDSIKRS